VSDTSDTGLLDDSGTGARLASILRTRLRKPGHGCTAKKPHRPGFSLKQAYETLRRT
jgi:hypothetical protein